MISSMDLHLRCQITFDNRPGAEDLSCKRTDHPKSHMMYKYTSAEYHRNSEVKSDRPHLGLPVRFPVQEEQTTYSEGMDRPVVTPASAENWMHYSNHAPLESHSGANHAYTTFPYHNYTNYGVIKESSQHYRMSSAPESRSSAISDAYGITQGQNQDSAQSHNFSSYYSGNRLMPNYSENALYSGYGFHGYGFDYSDRRFNGGTAGQYYYGNALHIPATIFNGFVDEPESQKASVSNYIGSQAYSPVETRYNLENDCSFSDKDEVYGEKGRRARSKALKYRTRTDEFPFSFQVRKQEKSMMKKLKDLEKIDAEKSKQLMEFYQYQMACTEREHKNKYQNIASAFTPMESSSFEDMEIQVMQIIQQVDEKIQNIYEEKECVRASSLNLCCGEIRKTRLLPKRSVKILESWFQENLSNPYPSRDQTVRLALDCGLTVEQVRKWFANKRNRSRNNRMHVIN